MFSTTIGPLEYVFSSGLRPQTGFELPFILLLTSLLLQDNGIMGLSPPVFTMVLLKKIKIETV